ncbi:MAG: glutamate 5-kinase [Candidatus Omnitrophica bacterium]|nr:glutamate 5-kinase [Candidatus Omnitrophota bacterium]
MKQSQSNYKRIVVKIGSSLMYSKDNKLDVARIHAVSRQVAELLKDKKEVIIVSSGAIAMGMGVLKLDSRPRQLHILQACAAIGQNKLMNFYSQYFKKYSLVCAQVLLTWDDVSQRERYLNAKNTLLSLLKLGVVPVINENDTVATDEIKFGDNDRLSSLVAGLVGADLLVILSDVDGLLDKDKKTVVGLVEEITPSVRALACPTNKSRCVGGMVTKLDAAGICVDSGIPCVITNGRKNDSILNALKAQGTFFAPKKDFFAARKHWLAFSAKPQGKIIVDDGAKQALLNNKSLLAVGVLSCAGDFKPDDIVSIMDSAGGQLAKGKTSVSSIDLCQVKGKRFNREVVHRDNLVITQGEK